MSLRCGSIAKDDDVTIVQLGRHSGALHRELAFYQVQALQRCPSDSGSAVRLLQYDRYRRCSAASCPKAYMCSPRVALLAPTYEYCLRYFVSGACNTPSKKLGECFQAATE